MLGFVERVPLSQSRLHASLIIPLCFALLVDPQHELVAEIAEGLSTHDCELHELGVLSHEGIDIGEEKTPGIGER